MDHKVGSGGPQATTDAEFAEQLSESQARLELATRAGEIGIWDWHLDTNEMVYSEQAKAIFGFPPDRPVTFAQVRDATHPEDLPRTSGMAKRALDPDLHEKEPFEYRIVRPDGSIRWVLAHGQAIFSGSDRRKAVRYIGTIQDITGRKRLEQALQESQARLRLALHVGKLAVWEFKGATETIVGSPELNSLLGFPPDREVTMEEYRERYAPGELDRLREIGRAALQRGDAFMEGEVKFILPSGEARWLLLRADFLQAEGRPPDLLGVVVDITERKRAEENLQFLMDELNHRVKNTFAVVQSIAAQTLRTAASPREARARVEERLQALSRAHDLLNIRIWRGADLREIVEAMIAPHVGERAGRMRLSGPAVHVPPRLALSLALMFHELATNALKYGGLSVEDGAVSIDWSADALPDGTALAVTWREEGGPPVEPPTRQGFGSQMMERSLAGEPGGGVRMDYSPDGLRCFFTVTVPPDA